MHTYRGVTPLGSSLSNTQNYSQSHSNGIYSGRNPSGTLLSNAQIIGLLPWYYS